jgi:hypothetical protein
MLHLPTVQDYLSPALKGVSEYWYKQMKKERFEHG